MIHVCAALAIEEWRPVVGSEGRYEISNIGNIRLTASRFLKPWIDKNGYYRIPLIVNGKRRHIGIANAVCAAYIGACPDGFQVNHIDGDKSKNRLSNLEFLSRKENIRHGISLGLRLNRTTVTPEIVRVIRATYCSVDAKVLAQRYGVSKNQIRKIAKGQSWAWVI
jgi:NUMOD4 motif/HNH endonuclease